MKRLVALGVLVGLLAPVSARRARAQSDERPAEPRSLGTGHLRDRGRVLALAVTADGQRIVTADADGSFVVREASTRRILSGFSPVASDSLRFPCFAIAPDGERIFMASSGANALRVHETKTGQVKLHLDKLEAGVRQLLVSPDGKVLAVRHEASVSLLDAASGELLRKQDVTATIGLAFSSDSKTLATSGKDGVFFHDVAKGKETRKKLVWHKKRDGDEDDDDDVHMGTHAPSSMAFSPDGTVLATAGGRSIRIWDLETNQLDCELEAEDFVGAIVFSPDGKRIASGGEDVKVQIWSLAKQKRVGALEGHADPVSGVAYSPDGKLLISGSKDGTIRAWDARSGDELEDFVGHRNGVRSLAFTKDGARLVSVGEDKRIISWDVAAGKTLDEYDGVRASVSPDGKLVAAQSGGKEIKLYAGEDEVRAISSPEEDLRLAGFSHDGKLVVGFTEGTRPVALAFEAKDGEEVQRAKLGKEVVRASALDPSRGFLYWIDGRDAIRTLDLESGATARFGERRARDLAFSPDGAELALLDDSGKLVVVDARTGEERRSLGEAQGPIAFGKGAIFAGGVLHVGERKTTLPTKATAVAFSPDGKLVATGDSVGSILIWPVR